MADTKITALAAITVVDPAADVLPIVDISDTSMAASGTTKKITSNQILGSGGTATLASATITGAATVGTTLGVTGNLTVQGNGPHRFGTSNYIQFDQSSLQFVGSRATPGALSIYGNGSRLIFQCDTVGYLFQNAANTLTLVSITNDATQLTLNSTGLGVGDAPAANSKLTIGAVSATGLNYALFTTGVTTGRLQTRLGNTGGVLLTGIEGSTAGQTITGSAAYSAFIGTTIANPLYLITDNAIRATVDASGNLLVGTTSNTNGSRVFIRGTGTAPSFAIQSATGDLAQPGLLVGKFDNDSTTSQILVRFTINNNASGSGQINANGASQAAFGSFSDSRLKENIVSIPSQLASILSLRPVEFDYKDGSGHQIGFVAQEMQEVYPDVVGEQDGFLTVTGWSKTEARLVSAIQELTARVQTLEAR